MRFPGLEDERVAGDDRVGAAVVANRSGAGQHVIELPLLAVRVKVRRLSVRRYALNLNVEWMPLVRVGRFRDTPERFRNLFSRDNGVTVGPGPRQLNEVVRVDLYHAGCIPGIAVNLF